MKEKKSKNQKNKWINNISAKLRKDDSGIYKLKDNKKEYIYLFEGRI